MHYPYVLLSIKGSRWYTVATNDLGARVEDHLQGRVESTRYKRPLGLIYYGACLSDADAIRRERHLETGKGKRCLRQRLATWLKERSPK